MKSVLQVKGNWGLVFSEDVQDDCSTSESAEMRQLPQPKATPKARFCREQDARRPVLKRGKRQSDSAQATPLGTTQLRATLR